MGAVSMGGLKSFYNEISDLKPGSKMPVMFVGHGSPMNAIEKNHYSDTWAELGKTMPVPAAILSVSAHWITQGSVKVATMPWPKTIHDFGGFPKELFDVEYPAPGSPDFAEQTIQLLHNSHAVADHSWGLDHGSWSVLAQMYPKANIPVYQISIDYSKPPEFHFNLMKELQILRNKGVLVIGSGNMVHNLYKLQMTGKPYDWCAEFDALMTSYIDKRDFQSVVDFQKTGNLAQQAHPSYDHFLPLLYSLGISDSTDSISYFNEGFEMGSISMRSLLITAK
jgi:4,5-DOPA dioxygenase extradiol